MVPIFINKDLFVTTFPGSLDGKESACNVGDLGSISVWKIPWRWEWLAIPVFLPGESHKQRSLVYYNS